jgi:hypothetical protein
MFYPLYTLIECLKAIRQKCTNRSAFSVKNIIRSYLLPIALSSGFVRAADLPKYSDIIAAVRASYDYRAELLLQAKGQAVLAIERSAGEPEARAEVTEAFSSIGVDPASMRLTGKGQAIITWYQKGIKRRYDIQVAKQQKNDISDEAPPYLVPENKRIAVDPEKGIYYDVIHKEAYIHRPPERARNMGSVLHNFDISRFYQYSDYDVPLLLETWEKKGIKPTITEEFVNQIRCVKLEFHHGDMARNVLWLAPELSYSLIKGQLFLKRKGVERLAESYEASYKKSGPKEVWLIDQIKIESKQFKLPEIVTAKFEDIKVGIEILDEIFTFEGLGVPPDTKIYDKSLGGQPLQYYYKSFPVGKVDELAEEILAQEKEKDKGKSDKINPNAQKQEKAERVVTGRQAKPELNGTPVAKVTGKVISKKLLWILYPILAIVAVAIIVAVRHRNLIGTKDKKRCG